MSEVPCQLHVCEACSERARAAAEAAALEAEGLTPEEKERRLKKYTLGEEGPSAPPATDTKRSSP